ncbi:MAG: hypothetical protein HKN47_15795 [Pirellulaceae bacterium]|nr:hypothetical protein [Pirellulaceae bacterium]
MKLKSNFDDRRSTQDSTFDTRLAIDHLVTVATEVILRDAFDGDSHAASSHRRSARRTICQAARSRDPLSSRVIKQDNCSTPTYQCRNHTNTVN